MDDLIAKLEAAPEGTEELDVAICRAVFGYKEDQGLWHCMPYTTSIDAALTLVPEGWLWKLRFNGKFCYATIHSDIMNREPAGMGGSFTGPLAICIAALKARTE